MDLMEHLCRAFINIIQPMNRQNSYRNIEIVQYLCAMSWKWFAINVVNLPTIIGQFIIYSSNYWHWRINIDFSKILQYHELFNGYLFPQNSLIPVSFDHYMRRWKLKLSPDTHWLIAIEWKWIVNILENGSIDDVDDRFFFQITLKANRECPSNV